MEINGENYSLDCDWLKIKEEMGEEKWNQYIKDLMKLKNLEEIQREELEIIKKCENIHPDIIKRIRNLSSKT
jgi:hypothetical protein